MNTQNLELLSAVDVALIKFVDKPNLFDNFNELTEVDALHQDIHYRIVKQISYEIHDKTRQQFK